MALKRDLKVIEKELHTLYDKGGETNDYVGGYGGGHLHASSYEEVEHHERKRRELAEKAKAARASGTPPDEDELLESAALEARRQAASARAASVWQVDAGALDADAELRRRFGARAIRSVHLEMQREGQQQQRRRGHHGARGGVCLLYTSPSPRDLSTSRMPSSA